MITSEGIGGKTHSNNITRKIPGYPRRSMIFSDHVCKNTIISVMK
jgi:hypothetical protein